jgi:hypothetical protein
VHSGDHGGGAARRTVKTSERRSVQANLDGASVLNCCSRSPHRPPPIFSKPEGLSEIAKSMHANVHVTADAAGFSSAE